MAAELGSAPPLGTEQYAEWEKCKKEVDNEIDMSLSETRLSVEGLEEAWEQWWGSPPRLVAASPAWKANALV